MLDIKLIRENPKIIKENLKKRNEEKKISWVDSLVNLDLKWRDIKKKLDELRHRRNEISEEINKTKKQGNDISHLIKEVKDLPNKISQLEKEEQELREKIDYYLMRLPNILDKSVPYGKDETQNKVIRTFGKKTTFKFKPKSHTELLEQLDIGDIERAAKISGARFYFLKNDLVRLEYAIMCFALDLLKKKGYSLIEPPYMINRKSYEGVTDLGAFQDVLYKIENEDLYLIATSEHAMGAMHMNEILNKLPLKYAGISPCFRKEAGAHGKDTKGIFRVHQFNKVEQFIFCNPKDSNKYHEELIKNHEEIFKKLKLPYRVVLLCSGDTGKISSKTYDLEVWMPVQKQYREAGSASNCTDFQARRLNIKYNEKDSFNLVHTLNSTFVATTRALVAILENYQQKDGSIKIPTVLQKYMNGLKKISANKK